MAIYRSYKILLARTNVNYIFHSKQVLLGWNLRVRLLSKGSHYDTLGIKQDATRKQIRAAFLKLSKELHPDHNRNDPQSHEKFVKLNEAYSVLVRPESRHYYDNQLTSHVRHGPTAGFHDYDVYVRRAGQTQWKRAHRQSPWHFDDKEYGERFGATHDSGFWQHQHQEDKRVYNDYANEWFFLRRRSHSWAVAECMVFLLFGVILFFVSYGWSTRVRLRMRAKQDKLFSEMQAMYGQAESEVDKIIGQSTTESINCSLMDNPTTKSELSSSVDTYVEK